VAWAAFVVALTLRLWSLERPSHTVTWFSDDTRRSDEFAEINRTVVRDRIIITAAATVFVFGAPLLGTHPALSVAWCSLLSATTFCVEGRP